jgi:hypothetical protein
VHEAWRVIWARSAQARAIHEAWRDRAAEYLPAVGVDDATLHAAARLLRGAVHRTVDEHEAAGADLVARYGPAQRRDVIDAEASAAYWREALRAWHDDVWDLYRTPPAPIADGRTAEDRTTVAGRWTHDVDGGKYGADYAATLPTDRDAATLRVMADAWLREHSLDGALGDYALLGSRWRAYEQVARLPLGDAIRLRDRMGASVVGYMDERKQVPYRPTAAGVTRRPTGVAWVPRPEGMAMPDYAMIRDGVVMVPIYTYGARARLTYDRTRGVHVRHDLTPDGWREHLPRGQRRTRLVRRDAATVDDLRTVPLQQGDAVRATVDGRYTVTVRAARTSRFVALVHRIGTRAAVARITSTDRALVVQRALTYCARH